MIINNGPQETAEVIGGIDTSNSMRMNLNAQSYELLLSNLYSDPLGSTIRELCTNAVEANQGSGTTRKVVIQMPNALSTDLIIKDYGTGLDDKEIDKYLNCLFSSSKGGSNDSMGGFGLGSKSPLALVDSFYLSSVKNGIQYDYMWIKERGQIPTPIFQGSDKVDSENGITITVPLGSSSKIPLHNLSSHVKQAVNRQLFGFKDLVRVVENASVPYDQMKDVTDKIITWKPILDLPSITFFERMEDPNRGDNRGYGYGRNNYNQLFIRIGTVVYRYNAADNLDFNWMQQYIKNAREFVITINVPIGKLDIPMSREEVNTTSENFAVISSILKSARTEIQKEYDSIPFDFNVGAIKYHQQLRTYSNNSSLKYNISAKLDKLQTHDSKLLQKLIDYIRHANDYYPKLDVAEYLRRVDLYDPLDGYINRITYFLNKTQMKVNSISATDTSAVHTIPVESNYTYVVLPSKLPFGVRLMDLHAYMVSKYPKTQRVVTIQYKSDYANPSDFYDFFKTVIPALAESKGKTDCVFADILDENDAKSFVKKHRAASQTTVLQNDFLVGVRSLNIADYRTEFNKQSDGSFICTHLTNSDHKIRLNKRLDDKGKAIPLGPEYLDSTVTTVLLTDSTIVPLKSNSSYPVLRESEVKSSLLNTIVIRTKESAIASLKDSLTQAGITVHTVDNPLEILVPTLEDSLKLPNPDEAVLTAMDGILSRLFSQNYLVGTWRSDSTLVRKRVESDLAYFEKNYATADNVYYKHIVGRKSKILEMIVKDTRVSNEYNYNQKDVESFGQSYSTHIVNNLLKNRSFWLKDHTILNSNCYSDSTAKALFKNFGYSI